MAILVIPVAVSVHTVVSFVFAMTIQPMWHSAIFGPYFVAGAIFSGIAGLIVAMNIIRKVYHLEDYLRPVHFNNLGILLLVMTLLWFYFTFTEYITVYYGGTDSHDHFLVQVYRKVCTVFLGDVLILFCHPATDSKLQKDAYTFRHPNRFHIRYYRHVAGTVCDRRTYIDQPEASQ